MAGSTRSTVYRVVSFPHAFPAKFSVVVNAVGFCPPPKTDLPTLEANLTFFLGRPLLIKLWTEPGKRVRTEADGTKKPQTQLFLPETLTVFHELTLLNLLSAFGQFPEPRNGCF